MCPVKNGDFSRGVSIVPAFRIPRHKGLMFEDNLGYIGRLCQEKFSKEVENVDLPGLDPKGGAAMPELL